MSVFVRTIALLLAFGVTAAPVLVSLFIASAEPSLPLQASWVVPFALAGFAAAVGYLVVAIIPRRLAVAAFELRALVACFMAFPCGVAAYLLVVTDSAAMVSFSLAVIAGTALLVTACVWPAWLARSNQSLQRTASGGL